MTTSTEPRLAQRTRRCSAGPQRTISSNATATRAAAAGRRRIRIGMLQRPETCPAQTMAMAPSIAARTRTARPHDSGKRIQNGRESGVSEISSSPPIPARMLPDTSQIARAAASASSPAVEDENTRCTVWSIPSNTWGRTFGLICGAMVCFHSCSWCEAPRMPSANSVHATAAMNMRSAIALAYVRRLCWSNRSTQSRTIFLKLCQRRSTEPGTFPGLKTVRRLVEAAQALLGELRRVENGAARRRRYRDVSAVVVEVHRHGRVGVAGLRLHAVGEPDAANEAVLVDPDLLGGRLHPAGDVLERRARQPLRLQRLGQVDLDAVVRRGDAVGGRRAEFLHLGSLGLEHPEEIVRLELAAGHQLAEIEARGLAELREVELDPLLAAGQLGREEAELQVDDVVAVLLERDLFEVGVPELPRQLPDHRAELEAHLGARGVDRAGTVHPKPISLGADRQVHAHAGCARVLRLRRSRCDRVELERAARAPATASRRDGSYRGKCQRGCDPCPKTPEHGRIVVPTSAPWG